MTEIGKTTRAQRMAMPLARDVVKDIAINHGGCIRPVQLRRTDLATGETEQVLVPCGHTLASVCPACAERAKNLRAAQCREAGTSTTNPTSSPTRPPTAKNGGSRTAPRSRPAATRPQLPEMTPRTWTSCSPNSMRKSAGPGWRQGGARPGQATAPVHQA